MIKNNKIIRKITSVAILLVLICMSLPLSASSASFSDVTDNKAVDVVTGLGLMEGNLDGTFTGEIGLSRAEFAHIIANIFKTGDMSGEEWKDKYFSDADEAKDSETEFVPNFAATETGGIFSDVTNSHAYYNDIMTVYSLGLMNGVGNGMFDTESTVTLHQAIKVIVTLLGYTPRAAIKGGYPNGYVTTANELKLLNGIDLSQSFNKFVMAQLLYNALDVEMLFLTGVGNRLTYESYENVTFTSELLGLYKYEDRLMDNGYTSLTGKSTLIPGQIMVGSKVIKNKNETSYVCDYIGREVSVYYDYEENTVKYACLARTDNITEIDSKDFVSFENNTFTYRKGEKNATVKVDNYAYLLHNGMGKSGYDNDTFDVNKGTIKIIESSKTGKKDFIILEDYHSFYVDFIDSANKLTYSKATLASNDKSLDFSEKDAKLIVIYDANGNDMKFDEIKAGSVFSVSQSDCMLKVYVSDNQNTEFLVDTVETQDGINVYSGAQKYVLSEDYIEMYPTSVPQPGKVYTAYFDIFGEIVKFVGNTDEKALVSYIVKCAADGDAFSSKAMCKYYSSEGRMIISNFADKVSVIKENDEEVLLTSVSKVIEVLGAYNGLAKIKTNDDGYITNVELPGEQKEMNNTPGRLVKIDIGDALLAENGITGYYYKINQGFQSKALVSSAGTKVIEVNHPITNVADIKTGNSLPNGVEPPSEEKDYQMTTVTSSFKNDDPFVIRAYTTIADSPFAEYIVHYKSVVQNLNKSTNVFGVIQRIYEGIDSEGNSGKIYEIYTTASKTEKLMLSEDFEGIVNLANETTYTDKNGIPKPFEIEKGDLVRYSLDANGKVTKFELVYDENAYNLASGGRGVLAGTIGNHNGGTDYGKYNPIAFNTNGELESGLSWNSGGTTRFFAGSPILVRDTAVKFTSQDLSTEGAVYNKDDPAYVTESYILGGFMHIKLEGGKVIASMQSSKSLLKPYEVVGNDCNRVVMMVRLGEVTRAVIYEGFLE